MPSRTESREKRQAARAAGKAASSRAPRKGASGTRGKRSSVKEKSGLLAAPAQIMGPRLLLVASVVLLCVVGLVMVYSASSITALNGAEYGNDPAYFLKRQSVFVVIGAVACVACAALPYRIWANKLVFTSLWALTVLLLAATAAGLGVSALGAERSIVIAGFALQPSEFAKISVLLTCASLFEVQREYHFTLARFVGIFLIAAVVPLVLIYRQPDLGTAIILAVGLLALMMLVGVQWYVIAGFVGVVALYVAVACITQPYHLERVVTMLDPWLDPQGKGFQSIQSLYAFGSGGVTGTGLGLSRQKYLYLPYAHTDFIFAIIGEELGLGGTVTVLVLFAAFIFAGMRISRSAPDVFGCSLAGSMTVMIGFQACVNMMCVTGIAPVTGKALPFISYGGSSLIATLIMVGIVLSVSLRSKVGAVHEARRENLFVIQGASGSARQTAPRNVRSLRVIDGLAGRVKDAAATAATRPGERGGASRDLAGRSRSSGRQRASRARHPGASRHEGAPKRTRGTTSPSRARGGASGASGRLRYDATRRSTSDAARSRRRRS